MCNGIVGWLGGCTELRIGCYEKPSGGSDEEGDGEVYERRNDKEGSVLDIKDTDRNCELAGLCFLLPMTKEKKKNKIERRYDLCTRMFFVQIQLHHPLLKYSNKRPTSS